MYRSKAATNNRPWPKINLIMTNVLQELIDSSIGLERKLEDVKDKISNFHTNKNIQIAYDEALKDVRAARASIILFVGTVNTNP